MNDPSVETGASILRRRFARRSASPAGMALDRLLEGPRVWIWIVCAALAGTAVVLTGVRPLVPVVQAALAWPVLWRDLRRGRLWDAVFHMLAWAVLISIGVIELTIHLPHAAEAGILRSTAYREEMFTWIQTGIGAEGSPAQFIPQHILHYALTLGLSFLSLGFAGLCLGAVLLNYMNYYVGALIGIGARPELGSIFGWPVWSMVRVAAFVIGALAAAVLLPGPLLGRIRWDPRQVRRALLLSFALFLLDLALKAILGPFWRSMLGRALLP